MYITGMISFLRLFLIIGFCLVSPFSVRAQIYDWAGKIIPGEAPKGRYSLDQVQPLALKKLPGELLDATTYRQNDDVFYEYVIKVSDGSVFEVEYKALDASLYEIEVRTLSKKPMLPVGVMKDNEAVKLALDYIEEHERGVAKSRSQGVSVGALNKKLVYNVEVRKGVHKYMVIVDAFDGEVYDSSED